MCAGGVEGDVDIAMGMRWGVKVNVLLLCTGINLSHLSTTQYIYGTVSAKIAPPLKCYKNASRLNRYNFPTDYAIDFLFSTLHREMV